LFIELLEHPVAV